MFWVGNVYVVRCVTRIYNILWLAGLRYQRRPPAVDTCWGLWCGYGYILSFIETRVKWFVRRYEANAFVSSARIRSIKTQINISMLNTRTFFKSNNIIIRVVSIGLDLSYFSINYYGAPIIQSFRCTQIKRIKSEHYIQWRHFFCKG